MRGTLHECLLLLGKSDASIYTHHGGMLLADHFRQWFEHTPRSQSLCAYCQSKALKLYACQTGPAGVAEVWEAGCTICHQSLRVALLHAANGNQAFLAEHRRCDPGALVDASRHEHAEPLGCYIRMPNAYLDSMTWDMPVIF